MTVSAARTLFARMASKAMPTPSRTRSRSRAPPLEEARIARSFLPQRGDRIEPRGFIAGKHARHHADARADNDRQDHDDHGATAWPANGVISQRDRRMPKPIPMIAPTTLSVAASTRNCARMSRRSRAQRLADPDLARPLGDRHQHDVHDHHRAHDEPDRGQRDAGQQSTVLILSRLENADSRGLEREVVRRPPDGDGGAGA